MYVHLAPIIMQCSTCVPHPVQEFFSLCKDLNFSWETISIRYFLVAITTIQKRTT